MANQDNGPSLSANDNHLPPGPQALAATIAASEQAESRQPNEPEDLTVIAKRNEKHKRKWNRRMRIFFCCLGHKKNKESIADVASIFAEFYSDLNAPSSDVAAGFVLLSKYQAAQRQWIVKNPDEHDMKVDQYLSGIPIKADTKFLDISTADDSHLMNDLIYYMNYSLAIFGWPLQVIDDPCMLCCIYPYLRLSPCCSSGQKRPKGGADCERAAKEGGKGRDKRMDKKKKSEKSEKTKSKKGAHKATVEPAANEEPVERAVKGESMGSAGQRLATTNDDENNNNNNNNNSSNIDNKCNGHRQPPVESLTQIQEISRSIPGRLNEDCDMPVILEDNCCGCNSASAERRLAQHNYEIVYISYKSNINVVPFLVAADHSKQTIVVAIRGSMSLSDMVTDMNGTVDRVPIENCPDDWLCHRGITRAAMYVKTTLLEERILERAFNCRPDLGSHHYNLVLCGHSLGAGAAGILGVLMRPLYPTLRAYLYSPPGGILSLPVVEYTKEFAIGIILGNDTVPRLGVAQLERLRYHTLLSLKSAQKSPGKILARALCPSMCFGRNRVDYDPEQSLDILHGTDGRAFDYNNTKIPFQVQPQVLYVPGRLIHIVKNYSFRSRTQRLWSGPLYQAVWTDNTNYDRVMISEGMFLDHLPNNLMHAMKMLFSRTLPGRREAVRLPSEAEHKSVPYVIDVQPPPLSLSTRATAETITTTDSSEKLKRVSSMDESQAEDIQVRSSELREAINNDHNNNNDNQPARLKNLPVHDDNNNNNDDINNNNNNDSSNKHNIKQTETILNAGTLEGL